MTDEERQAAGLAMRTKVLGEASAEAARASRNDFNGEIQDYMLREVWGSIWNRPGLDLKTRSCMVLSVMMALGRWEEFRLHVKAGFNNGLGKDDIKEIILQNIAYCGAPVGRRGVIEAEAAFSEMNI
ncbi:MAG: 4-carboxymuconolactone decarboxylase [Rhodospirillaceae bacterium]|nr:4-carboxymuconolactone decarboxylase [Rhodospirillaceae bacterium]MBT6291844.1 4-carboxymuconolactone decarboxylase [Rhodospirillaceae bacterium]